MQVRDKVARPVLHAVGIDRAAETVTLVPEQRLIAAQNGSAALPQALEDLELGPADALARAEKLDVRGADVGDDGVIRLRRRCRARQLAEVVHAHLRDHDLGVLRHAHERQRQADLVVEVALGLFRAELLREHGVKQPLGRGLLTEPVTPTTEPSAHRAAAARQIEQRSVRCSDAAPGPDTSRTPDGS